MKNIQIAIIGGSLNGNSGAEAMLNTAIRKIEQKFPQASFGIFTPYYKDDLILWKNDRFNKITLIDASPKKLVFIIFPLSILAGFFKYIRLNIVKKIFPEPIRFLWESDVCIDIAGVSFIDSRLIFLPFNILSIYPSFLMQVPVVKYAQATGPYNNFINRFFARLCLKQCNHIFARGTKTFQYIQGLKIAETRYSLSTDVCFCSEMGDCLTENNPSLNDFLTEISEKKATGKILIGICPSSVIFEKLKKMGTSYVDFLTDLTNSLVTHENYHIVIFANATKEHKPQTFRNNDLPLIVEVADKINSSCISSYTANLNADGVKSIINCLDLCVVSRFHAMIFALTLRKPIFVIGWSHKYLEVMEQFGLSEYIADFRDTDFNEIEDVIVNMVAKKEMIEQLIDRHIDRARLDAFKQIDFTRKLLCGSKK
jgi:polysaccharide pyruvyl transferase WcaK-like protein